MTQVKVCGVTRVSDALAAQAAGADAVGFVFAEGPRRIEPAAAREIARFLDGEIVRVGVFVDATREEILHAASVVPLDVVQLHGSETREFMEDLGLPAIKAFRARNVEVVGEIRGFHSFPFLLDAYSQNAPGGTGRRVELEIARRAGSLGPMVLAGGLRPDNVGRVLSGVRPAAVDVSSGVEVEPGKKDRKKLFTFLSEVKRCDIRMSGGTSAPSGAVSFPKPFSRR